MVRDDRVGCGASARVSADVGELQDDQGVGLTVVRGVHGACVAPRCFDWRGEQHMFGPGGRGRAQLPPDRAAVPGPQ